MKAVTRLFVSALAVAAVSACSNSSDLTTPTTESTVPSLRGGSGGGGGSTTVSTAIPLVYDYTSSSYGTDTRWDGSYDMLPAQPGVYYSYDLLTITVRTRNLSAADGTQFRVKLYLDDAITGAPLAPRYMYQTMSMLGGAGQIKNAAMALPQGIHHRFNRLEVVDAGDNVIAAAH